MGFGLVATGCGDNAPASPDDVPFACTPTTDVYRLVTVDPSARVAQTLDLDGDGQNDDALGRAHDLFVAFEPSFAIAPRFADRLATDVPWLVAVDHCDGQARVTIERAMSLDGPQLLLPRVLPRAVGTLAEGVIDARDGTARMPLIALGDPLRADLSPGWREASDLAIHATATGDELTGQFAAAFDTDAMRLDLAPPIAALLTAQPADDPVRIAADVDHDGVVTVDEVSTTNTFRGLTQSDITLDTTPSTSVAFAFTATRLR